MPAETHHRIERLAAHGEARIEWASRAMPVLAELGAGRIADKAFEGLRVALCLHLTAETGVLASLLGELGAEVSVAAAHPLSTQDDVAAALASRGIPTHAQRGADSIGHRQQIRDALSIRPQLVVDNSGLAIAELHDAPELLSGVLGGTLETRSGVAGLRALAESRRLAFPVIAVNEARTKHLFDNRLGTGQSVIDGILRATGRLLAGSAFVVAGYGHCGRGIAERARGMGARVFVTEVDPVRALEAAMDGYRVTTMAKAAKLGDFFCAATGSPLAIRAEHFAAMRDGAIVANAGLFDEELDLPGLDAIARPRRVRELVDEYELPSGRRISVIASGALVNLVAGEGHPSALMDLSFANLVLCLDYLARHADSLERKVYAVPDALDREIAELKLRSMGVAIDKLSRAQRARLRAPH
ncbi:adenosylhomocysteinase [Vulgatibacter incomptus]|uniref:Adenosylhomocysteinase n=1 Tax=Vulgatibacter incomptus TaxID=1391653 RepID=A0A0K1PFR3_9BACT|nr:adenosylhomocysteinase [Vulgatibacter incomptus]AKU92360.1 Adenosylhomocysteinase [Vulgatibacter incomptus]